MSTITITVDAYGMKHQIQFSDNRVITIDDALGEMYKILALLGYTPQTIADVAWQETHNTWDDTTDDRLLYETEFEEQLARITAKNIFEIIAPGIRPDTCTTVTEKQLQAALEELKC